MKRLAFIFLLTLASPMWGTTYYISITGSDSGNCSSGTPCSTITHALTLMTTADMLIVNNGTYTDRAGMLVNDHFSATIPNNVTIQAETPYGVRLKWTGNLNYYDAPVLIEKASGVHIDGFIYEMLNLADPQYVVELDGNNNTVTRTIVKRNMVDAYGGWYAIGGNDNLIEDAAGVGAARYGFYAAGPDATTQRNIFRRCVGRMDFANTAQPKATFAFYGNNAGTLARDFLFQNCIAIDGQRPSANGGEEKYGGFYCPKSPVNVSFQGCIVLNEDGGHAGIFAREMQGANTAITDTAIHDVRGFPWTAAIRGNSGNAGFWRNSNIVIGNAPSAYYNQDSATEKTLVNLTRLSSTPETTSSDYGWSSKNLTAVSTISILGGVARLSVRYGVDGTHWGQAGFDQLTSVALWPWPNESQIASVFAEQMDTPTGYTPTGNVSARGFAGGGTGLYGGAKTLTSYIWEYLGNACPLGICAAASGLPLPCRSDGSCSAGIPACGLTTIGVNNCGMPCSKTGPPCPVCISNGSCSAAIPACGTTTTGVDNCGLTCSKIGGACPPPPVPVSKIYTIMLQVKDSTGKVLKSTSVNVAVP